MLSGFIKKSQEEYFTDGSESPEFESIESNSSSNEQIKDEDIMVE